MTDVIRQGHGQAGLVHLSDYVNLTGPHLLGKIDCGIESMRGLYMGDATDHNLVKTWSRPLWAREAGAESISPADSCPGPPIRDNSAGYFRDAAPRGQADRRSGACRLPAGLIPGSPFCQTILTSPPSPSRSHISERALSFSWVRFPTWMRISLASKVSASLLASPRTPSSLGEKATATPIVSNG